MYVTKQLRFWGKNRNWTDSWEEQQTILQKGMDIGKGRNCHY
jgi:hypothetical protein